KTRLFLRLLENGLLCLLRHTTPDEARVPKLRVALVPDAAGAWTREDARVRHRHARPGLPIRRPRHDFRHGSVDVDALHVIPRDLFLLATRLPVVIRDVLGLTLSGVWLDPEPVEERLGQLDRRRSDEHLTDLWFDDAVDLLFRREAHPVAFE